MKRVFLGIDLPQEIKTKIEKLKKEYRLERLPIKLVEPQNSHIAIKFLDDLTAEQIEAVIMSVDNEIAGFKSFKTIIDGSLVFPNFLNPRVLALKVISPNLLGLAKKIFAGFLPLNFILPEERPYTPHITLGRIKDNLTELEIERLKTIKFNEELWVDSVQLFESQLAGDGPIYTVLNNFTLK